MHTFKLRTWEAEAGEFLGVWSQPGIQDSKRYIVKSCLKKKNCLGVEAYTIDPRTQEAKEFKA